MPAPTIFEMSGAPRPPSRFVPIYVRRWMTGLWTNRSPLLEPGTRMDARFEGGRPDTLIGGNDMILTAGGLWTRRPGTVQWCSYGFTETIQSFSSYRNLAGTIQVLLGTSGHVYLITAATATAIFTKAAGASITQFQTVGNFLYFADAVNMGRWDGTVARNCGIAAPTTSPTLSFSAASSPVWAAATAYALGAEITDPYQNLQKVTAPGTSGANPPTWQRGPSQVTSDGAALQWTNEGHDPNAAVFEQVGCSYVYCYYCAATGHYSTASPASGMTGPQANQKITVSGDYSTDPQVDKIAVFRTLDGGSTWLLLETVANNTAGGTWSYVDLLPDSALNPLVVAPLDHANDPPPAGSWVLAFHAGRMWVGSGNNVYFSGGPDTVVGNGNEAYPPANVFTFPGQVTRLIPASSYLLVFTTSAIYAIAGTQLANFAVQLFQSDIGLLSPNAIATMPGAFIMFSADRRLLGVTGGSSIADFGFPVGDRLAQIDPTKAYVAFHFGGSDDSAVYVSDGASQLWRANPAQPPEGGTAFSTPFNITGGVGAIGECETSPGVHELLLAAPSGTQVVQALSSGADADNGSAFPCAATIGTIVLGEPGQPAVIAAIITECAAAGTRPTVGILLDEVSGTFAPLASSVNDPPQLPAGTSVYAQRFYLNQAADPQECRYAQIQIAFPAEAAANAIYSLTLYGGMGSAG